MGSIHTMLLRVGLLYITGLLTIVPYGIWHLLFYAQRDEYAWLITIVLFWVFGFWGVVTPLMTAVKIHQVMRVFEFVHSKEELLALARQPDSEMIIIEMISSENHIPRFVARMVYRRLIAHVTDVTGQKESAHES